MKWEIQRYIRDEVISIEGKRHPVNTYLINILGKKKNRTNERGKKKERYNKRKLLLREKKGNTNKRNCSRKTEFKVMNTKTNFSDVMEFKRAKT